MTKERTKQLDLIRRPEEAIYRSIYAPTSLTDLLTSAETRSRIRRLPAVQVYFGMKELSDEEIGQLVPHVTQQQWQATLDLDLWTRDQPSVERFLALQRHLLLAEDPVARKLVAAADFALWEYAFNKMLRIHSRIEDDMESEPKSGEVFETPDHQYVLELPKNPEMARLLRAILTRLYQLDVEWTRLRLESARFRTHSELREASYQNRTGRVEEMGFQEYYQALEIYAPVLANESLPRKRAAKTEPSTLPALTRAPDSGTLLMMQTLAYLSHTRDVGPLLEELFFVCNRVLTADRVSPADPRLVKRGIRKALAGISLGLDILCGGRLEKAAQVAEESYLQTLFRIGHTRLLTLQARAARLMERRPPAAESPDAIWVKGLLRKYPAEVMTRSDGRKTTRFFSSFAEIEAAEKRLEKLSG